VLRNLVCNWWCYQMFTGSRRGRKVDHLW